MKNIFTLLFLLLFIGCKDPAKCPTKFQIPVSLSPIAEEYKLGDTITIASKFSKQVLEIELHRTFNMEGVNWQPAVAVTSAPGTEVAADSVPKKARPGEKRQATDAMSPGHLTATAARTPGERRVHHTVMAVDKGFRDTVKDAAPSLEFTKDVREIQHVLEQAVKVIADMQKYSYEQEARIVLAVQRTDGVDPKLQALDNIALKQKDQIEDSAKQMAQRMRELDREMGNRDKHLHTCLAAQENILTERIEEIKGMFLKCDQVFAKKDDVPPSSSAGAASIGPLDWPSAT